MAQGKKRLPEADRVMTISVSVTRSFRIIDSEDARNRVCTVAKCGLEATEYIRTEASCGIVLSALSCVTHQDRVHFILRHMTPAEIVMSVPATKHPRLIERCRAQSAEAIAIAAELTTNPKTLTDEFLADHRLPRELGIPRMVTRLAWRAMSLELIAQITELVLGKPTKTPRSVESLLLGAV